MQKCSKDSLELNKKMPFQVHEDPFFREGDHIKRYSELRSSEAACTYGYAPSKIQNLIGIISRYNKLPCKYLPATMVVDEPLRKLMSVKTKWM